MNTGEEPEEVDGTGWASKPIEDWCQEETINWLMMAASCHGQSYGSIQQGLALPGKELAALSRHDFVARDPVYGERLYNLLHTQAVSSQCKSAAAAAAAALDYYAPRHGEACYPGERPPEGYHHRGLCNDDEPLALGSNNVSGAYYSVPFIRFLYTCGG